MRIIYSIFSIENMSTEYSVCTNSVFFLSEKVFKVQHTLEKLIIYPHFCNLTNIFSFSVKMKFGFPNKYKIEKLIPFIIIINNVFRIWQFMQ